MLQRQSARVMTKIVLLLILPTTLLGQVRHSGLDTAAVQARSAVLFPFSLLVPEGIRIGYEMRSYIASPAFGVFDSSVSAKTTFNEIYFEAVELAHGDISNALLAASIGSFEHEYIPLDILGIIINLPLTSESHSRFERRWSHLPAYLYHTQDLDRDKLQHFFASAWLKSTLGMDWLVALAGEAVEQGENLFVIGGFVDPRDLHANEDGLHFATRSETKLSSRPSESLTPNP